MFGCDLNPATTLTIHDAYVACSPLAAALFAGDLGGPELRLPCSIDSYLCTAKPSKLNS